LKGKQCPIEQASKKEALAELQALEEVGLIELFYGDESGFWQNPVIARAWQFAGEEIRLLPEKGKRLSVFGLLNRKCEGQFWSSEKTIKTEFVIECLEEWIKTKSNKPRVLVLDNARIHRSKKMQEKLAEWEEKGFYIFNLPTYSPHLNIIEILWRKMKYEWLKPEDYALFEILREAIKEILSQLGAEYKINFQAKLIFRTEYV
jgi:transposase